MKTLLYQPVQTNTTAKWKKILALSWRIVNGTVYRFSPFFFRGWRRGLLRLFGADIHPTSSPNRLSIIDCPWNLKLGAFSSLGPRSWIYALNHITIGEKTCIGDGVKILTGTHDISDCHFSLVTAPITIGDCCWVATSATILPGVIVHEGGVVGACSVVTKNVESWTVVAGNPARLVKKREIRDS